MIEEFEGSHLFESDYDSARSKFRAEAAALLRKHAAGDLRAIPVPSRVESDLTMDVLYLPPSTKPEGLVVVVSGVHGVEAPTGSAVQRWMMSELTSGRALETARTGYLFIHAVNPFGYRHGRRVTETGVDLNRNFLPDEASFSRRRPEYPKFTELLNPRRPARSGALATASLVAHALPLLVRNGFSDLRQSVTNGQYEEPRGIFFGGTTYEPHEALLSALISEFGAPYRKVLFLDVHSGYGERGVLHLFPNPPRTEEMARRFQQVFGDARIDTGWSKEFYESDGDCTSFFAHKLEEQGKIAVPMVLEFGTLDSQNVRGAFDSMERVILENQAHHFGAVSDAALKRIQHRYRTLFVPEERSWREAVLRQAAAGLPLWIERFATLV